MTVIREDSQFMPTRQAGDRLGKSQRQVRAMIRRGELSGHKFARRSRRKR